MNITIQNGAVELNGDSILEKVNFEINDGEHIAIVGKNGAGKTTLLNAIINNDMFTKGIGENDFTITKTGKYKIGYLKQITINENETLYNELKNSFTEIVEIENKMAKLEKDLTNDKNIAEYTNLFERYQLIGGYTYQKDIELIISKFGFKDTDKEKKISEFSGGEKIKISFMKLLLSAPDLMILDEPTNHLDITTIEWLEEYLKNYKKAIIVVSHDRLFLDNIANIIYEIEYGETVRYVGNYTKYTELKKERYNKLLKDYEFQQSEIKRLNDLFLRFRYKPTKAKMAMSKLKQIERMQLIDKPNKADTKTFKINVNDIQKSGKIALTAKNLEFGYDKPLGKVNFEIERGKRIAIIGANGKGKSTLLKTLSKRLKPISGTFEYGYNIQSAYFDQNLKFDTNGTILDEFCNKFPKAQEIDARNALGAFLFSGEDVQKNIEKLSGGEKVRLLLCEIFYSKPNLIFLDEPTNHLDIIGKEKLEETLKQYTETIVFVSHDRYFIKQLADEIIYLDDNEIKHYSYGYEQYLNDKKASTQEATNANEKSKNQKQEIEQKEIEKPKESDWKKEKNNRNNERQLKKIEREIEKLEDQIKTLNEEMYKEENCTDYEKLNEINSNIDELKKQLAKKEEQWEKMIS